MDKVCSFCGEGNVYAKGLCRKCYHRALRNGSPERRPRKNKSVNVGEIAQRPWRERVACLVMGDDGFTIGVDDFDDAVDFAISKLPDVQRDVLLKTIRDGMTLQSVANEYGCTREWIRQKRLSAIRVLRGYSDLFQYGIDGTISREEEKAKTLNEKFDRLEQLWREANIREGELRRIESALSSVLPVSTLGLSARALNAICRDMERKCGHPPETVGEVVMYLKPVLESDEPEDEAKDRLWSVGTKTAKEIVEKINNFARNVKIDVDRD